MIGLQGISNALKANGLSTGILWSLPAIGAYLPDKIPWISPVQASMFRRECVSWYKGRSKIDLEIGMFKEPIHVTDDTFEKAILQSDLPVVVDFWAPWCGPCKMVAPTLEKLAQEYAGKLVVAKVNTDENPRWATELGVQGIPTMLFVSGGTTLHRQVGAVPEPYLRDMVEEFLNVLGKKQDE
jgi:thioredoxin 1